jgi:hypothetical protein
MKMPFAKLGLLLILCASMSACSGDQKWKEEVQLSDGRIIVVEREMLTALGGGEWATNRSGIKPKEYRFRFEYPNGSGKIIEWHSTKIDSQTWPEVPLILAMESGQPVVFAIIGISSACEVYSKYVYRNGAWVEEVLPEKFEKQLTNLFLKVGVDMPSFVNLETKRKINSSVDYRRSLKQVGPTLKICG